MKKSLLILLLSLSVISCSTSKKTASRNSKTNVATNNNSSETVRSLKISNQINAIIQSRLGVPISAIARSEITKTKTGYQWKFMNVRTGAKFIGSTNLTFQDVRIMKYKKNQPMLSSF